MQLAKGYLPSYSLLYFFLSFALFGREINVQDKLSHVSLGTLNTLEFGRQSFISLEEFAKILAIPTDKSSFPKTICLDYKQNRIVFTANSPFVHFNDSKYQMTTEVRFPNREFYVSLTDLINGLKKSGINTLALDASGNILYALTRPANLVRLSTTTEDDTTKIILHATRSFRNEDVSTVEEEGWLYITIKGGVIDLGNLSSAEIPQIFEFIPQQISQDQAKLSLHLAPNTLKVKVRCSEATHEIVITLATTSIMSSAVLSELQKEREKWKIDTIILDPGHGGRDAGCVGPGKIYEKNIVLNIANAVKTEIEKRMNVNVVVTRDRDVFITLKDRTQKANEAGGKLFISFHVDANRVKSLRGHTVYFLGPAKTDDARAVAQFENSVIKFEDSQNEYAGLSDMSFILAANAQNSYNKESQDFASMIDQEIKEQCGSKSLGVRQAGFYVLYGASMPNILIETGFMTNSSDRNQLNTRTYQNSLAQAVVDGIVKFKAKYESTNF